MITDEQWQLYFDIDGRILHEYNVRKAIFLGVSYVFFFFVL